VGVPPAEIYQTAKAIEIDTTGNASDEVNPELQNSKVIVSKMARDLYGGN
jgi:hypothetical protein